MSVPIEEHRTLPGNIGNGANRDAVVNIKKKIIRIGAPLIVKPLSKGFERLFLAAEWKGVVIFNKRCCRHVQQEYR
jgi:hypothetical protein